MKRTTDDYVDRYIPPRDAFRAVVPVAADVKALGDAFQNTARRARLLKIDSVRLAKKFRANVSRLLAAVNRVQTKLKSRK